MTAIGGIATTVQEHSIAGGLEGIDTRRGMLGIRAVVRAFAVTESERVQAEEVASLPTAAISSVEVLRLARRRGTAPDAAQTP